MSIRERMEAMAEKMSRQQLEQSIRNGSLPAYVGIPLLEEKMQQEKRMQMAAMAAQPQAMPIAQRVMSEAQQMQDIEALPTSLEFAGGGIVAFDDGGPVESYASKGLVAPDYMEEVKKYMPGLRPELTLPDIYQQGIEARKMYGIDDDLYKTQKAEIEKEKADIEARRSKASANRWVEAGLAMLGGTSPHMSVNLAQALPAIRGYSQDMKDFDTLGSALRKETQLLARDQDKAMRTQAASDVAQVQKRKDDIYAGQQTLGTMAIDLSNKERDRANRLEQARIQISKPTEIQELERLATAAAAGDKNAQAALEGIKEVKRAGNPYASSNLALNAQDNLRQLMADKAKALEKIEGPLKTHGPGTKNFESLPEERKEYFRNLKKDYDRISAGYDSQISALQGLITNRLTPGAAPSAAPQAAPAALPPGLPKGSVPAGKDEATGKIVYKTPDGKLVY